MISRAKRAVNMQWLSFLFFFLLHADRLVNDIVQISFSSWLKTREIKKKVDYICQLYGKRLSKRFYFYCRME